MPTRPTPQFEYFSDLTGFRAPTWHVVRLTGRLRRRDDLFRALDTGLKLPTYFGHNWDALDECLRDLSWLGAAAGVVLLHERTPLTDAAQRKTYGDILRNAQATGRTPLRIVLPLEAAASMGR